MALFKLIYVDQKSGDTKRYLYASTTGVPADTDAKVAYDPNFIYGEGSGEKCYIYNSPVYGKAGVKVGESKTQIPSTSDAQTSVTVNGVDIFNEISVYTLSVSSITTGVTASVTIGSDSYDLSTTTSIPVVQDTKVTLSVTNIDGNTLSVTAAGEIVTMTKVGETEVYTGTFTVKKATALVITSTAPVANTSKPVTTTNTNKSKTSSKKSK